MWLDTLSLQGAGTLATLVAPRGPGTLRYVVVRCVVAFAMVSLIFGKSQPTSQVRACADLVRDRIAWPPLLAHLGVTLLFAGLSSILFGPQLPTALNGALIALWIVSGLTSAGLAAVAFMPAAFWLQLFRSVRHVLAFALVVSVGAYAFARMALTFWQPLSRGTLGLAYAMLHPFVPAVTADPASFMIGARDFQVQITAECSGYEGLGLILVFTSAWLWFHRTEWQFPQALALVPCGLLAIWIINSMRVAALVLIGIAGAPDIALGGFHSQAGWLGFTAVALGICAVARRLPWLRKGDADTSSSPSPESVSNPTAAYLVPFMAILAGSMVAQLGSKGFEWLYPIRVIASAAALWYFARRYRTLNWRIGWTSIGLGFLAFVIWVSLEPLVGTGLQVSMPLALSQAPARWEITWLAFRILGAVVTVPLAEELAFRGFLLRRFDSSDFQSVNWPSVSWFAILLSSVTFGVLHGERWLAGTIAGVIFASALLRRRSIGDAVAAHATANALIAGWVLVGGHWQLW
jgi:exosortase E/protease (VPEID-CTERM system)